MFYKQLEDDTITYGNFVHSEKYLLDYEFKDQYQLPIDGWYWFNTVVEAEQYFKVQIN